MNYILRPALGTEEALLQAIQPFIGRSLTRTTSLNRVQDGFLISIRGDDQAVEENILNLKATIEQFGFLYEEPEFYLTERKV